MFVLNPGETMNPLPPQGLLSGQRVVGSEDEFVKSDACLYVAENGNLKEKGGFSLT